jgi:hypothetical protein
MANSKPAGATATRDERACVWDDLKQAIASSSGFKRWQLERGVNGESSLDGRVCHYLRETLETLAY